MFEFMCPVCLAELEFSVSVEEAEGVTTDCSVCGALLIVKESKVLDFHKWMHSRHSVWPADGIGTGMVNVNDDGDIGITIKSDEEKQNE